MTVRQRLTAEIDRLYAELDRADSPGAVVLVDIGEERVHTGCYGRANVEHAVAWTPTTRYRVASITKSLIAQAAVRLATDGRLALDEPVPGWAGPATPRQLLSMSGGLPLDEHVAMLAGTSGPLDPDHLTHLAASAPRSFPPGTAQLYSCSGYRRVGVMIEQATDLSLGDALRLLVLDPIGLAHSELVPRPPTRRSRQATRYLRGDDGWRVDTDDTHSTGDGGLVSTAADLAAWLRASRRPGGTAGVPGLSDLLDTPVPRPSRIGDYRMGCMLHHRLGTPSISHTGTTGTRYVHLPEADISIVALHNRDDVDAFWLTEQVAELVLRAIGGGDAPGRWPIAGDDPRVATALGTYLEPRSGLHLRLVDAGECTDVQIGTALMRLLRFDGCYGAVNGTNGLELTLDDDAVVLDAGFGAPRAFHRVHPRPADDDRLVGTYRARGLEAVARIRRTGDRLQLVRGTGHCAGMIDPLVRLDADAYAAGGISVAVQRSAHGIAEQLQLSAYLTRGLPMHRSRS